MPSYPLLFTSGLAITTGCFSPSPIIDTNDDPSSDSTTDADHNGAETDEPGPAASSSTAGPSADEGSDADGAAGSETGSEPGAQCGDGVVDEHEQCDLGDDNGPESTCLPECVLNVCGDGAPSPEEACDDGLANALAIGACAPDCSTVIETRQIVLGGSIAEGDFGANPVATADSQCDPGWLAMFAVPGVRQATTVPNESVDPIDWVLSPYTAYARPDGTLLWITDDVPLLGVRDAAPQPLLNSIVPQCPGVCVNHATVTGMNADWTTPAPLDCEGWSSGSSGVRANFAADRSATDFLMAGEVDCEFQVPAGFNGAAQFYCVEQ